MYTEKFKYKLIEIILKNLSKNYSFNTSLENSLKELKTKISDNKRISTYYFPNNFQSFIIEYINKVNEELLKVSKKKIENKGVSDKIFTLVIERLIILSKYKIANKKIFRFLCLPQNIIFSNKILFKISDEIWFISGDRSLDFNFYSKRFILMNIYLATFIFWINDDSINLEMTKEFLKKQIKKTSVIGKYKVLLKNLISKFNF
tara:strand:+ start:193 stop:804 length:612 start_codon:yes stop_codon:yes gene_type:complete